MRNPGWSSIMVDPLLGTTELDGFVCFHCNCAVTVKSKANPDDFGSMCRNCMKMVCKKCANFGCTPFEKRLEEAEAKDRARRSYGI